MTSYSPPLVVNGVPSGVPMTPVQMDDPVFGAPRKITVITVPEDGDTALAFALAGDLFPRILIMGNPQDPCMFFGDGTSNPFAGVSGAAIMGFMHFGRWSVWGGNHDLEIGARAGFGVVTPNDLTWDTDAIGPVLLSPDGTKHRITVNNAGALTTVVVP